MLALDYSATGLAPGEGFVSNTPVLARHSGTQPDLFLRWNRWARDIAAVDVAVHLHGFSQHGATMSLAEKVPRSGLDTAGRARPTLALLPRGNWVRRSWYDFPSLLDGGIDRLIDYALQFFTAQAGPLTVDRLILTAHSGGGMPAIDALAAMSRAPDELFVFDGLYGRDPGADDPLRGIEWIDGWLGDRLAVEPGRPGALRIVYIERQTGPFSREVGRLIARRLAATPASLRKALAKRYRVEPSGVPHGYVAAICGPALLADAGADFDWRRV